MKILELRCKNLNSLYGEWHIDFTESEYAYNGIFALTGPTGAGKSTILDAICLALYGSTPRLGRITQSSNDIMSRQTGECYAEVVFASQAGKYRCNWAHHRSGKKVDGKLQSPRHEIAEATGECKIIENKLTSVLAAVEEKTGMDFERFTRSILLAQGGFDTFLKATVEQKSKILEQITGTKIYSEISIGVHERLRDEKNSLMNLEAETRGILILTPEEEQASEEALKVSQHEEHTLGKLVGDLTKAITWLQGIAMLEEEIQALSVEKDALTQDLEVFSSQRLALDGALQASTVEGLYATLTEMRNQQKSEITLLAQEEKHLPLLESEAQTGTEALAKAEELTKQAKDAQKEAIPTIRQVRALDQNLIQMQTSITESKAAIAADTASIASYRKRKDNETKKIKEQEENLKLVTTYLTEHLRDKALVTDLTGINEQIQALSSKQNETEKKALEEKKAAKALAKAVEALEASTKKSLNLKTVHDTAQANLQSKKDALILVLGDKLLREYRSEKDTLLREREFLARIAALEEHRANLADGKACPLCGSLEHPFAVGNVPTSDETDKKIASLSQIITQAEDLESKIQDLLHKERSASTAHSDQMKLESDAQYAKESALTAHTMSLEALEEANASFLIMEENVAEKLKAYGIEEIPENLSTLLASLRSKRDIWLAKEDAAKTIETTCTSIKEKLQHLTGILDTQELALQAKQASLNSLNEAFALALQDRKELYGDKGADREEERVSLAVISAETAEKKASKHATDLLQKVSISKTRIESLQTTLTKRKPELARKEDEFLDELSSLGFPDESEFLLARLSALERTHLASQAKTLDDRQMELKTKLKDRTTKLRDEQARIITDKPLVELHPLFLKKEEALKEVREAAAEHKAKLKGNVEAKQRISDKQEVIENQRKEFAKWDKLHSLIGSADGKKFRNFAQGLTFELMVSHANRQLAKMSERYLLIRDDDQPLELNVIDNYQGGEIRSTKNLSGGESFIVSLTLALGLSKMASRKVRVDSLFLDEGFGTLDEESLETALKTLSGLQQDGKLIGVISHVSAMQEMISTQIVITPVSGGRSIMTGPGCSKIG